MAKSSQVSESKSLPVSDPAIAMENAPGIVSNSSQSDDRSKLPPTLGKLGCGPIILDFHSLANGRSEIFISLDGEAYRLRLTRNNKLILTK
jgi:hypothetical protein